MITTNKKDMEKYYGANPDEIVKVRLNSDEIVYIRKDADTSGGKLIRMYKKNGNAIVERRWKCKEWSPLMLHPENICIHPRENWKTFVYSWGEKHDYCPICSPQWEDGEIDPLNVENNLC